MTESSLPSHVNSSSDFVKEIAQILGGYTLLYVVFFSPIIFGGRLLAFSDTVLTYLPNFLVGIRLWDPLILSGFPTAADPQSMYWYPLMWIFSLLGSWNGFVLSTFVLSSSFMHGYVFSLTKSRFAAIVAGMSYGMCAFMTAHLSHTTLVHAAPWIVLFLWSVERLSAGAPRTWFFIGTVATALCLLSGHPQMFIYMMITGSIYALVRGWQRGPRFFLWYAGMVVAGICLAAVQVLPFIELAGMSHRARTGFREYVSYSLPPGQLICLFFPFLFGAADRKYFPWYSGEGNFAELACYLGFIPVLLGVAGLLRWRNRTLVWLWLGIATFALLQMLGGTTPLAWLLYHLPVFNKLRAPARNTFILSMAVSVLAGMGIAAIQQQIISRKVVSRILFSALALMLFAVVFIGFHADYFPGLSNNAPFTFVSIAKPALILPCIIFVLALASIFLWSRKTNSHVRKVFLLLILFLDLGVFGWFVGWRTESIPSQFTNPPSTARQISELVHRNPGRFIPIRGDTVQKYQLPANLSRLWNIPNAGGYGPLMLWRYGKMLSILTTGVVDSNWSLSENRAIDLLSIRYILVPRTVVSMSGNPQTGNIAWSIPDLRLSLGQQHLKSPLESASLRLIRPVDATAIGLVTALSWAGNAYQDEEMLDVELVDTSDKIHPITIRAGQDTSEWAYDCVPEGFYHSKAKIFESVSWVEKKCETHRYFSIKKFGTKLNIKEVRFQVVGTAVVNVHKVSLFDETQNVSFPLSIEGSHLAEDTARWRGINRTPEFIVYENMRSMPRAWIVPKVTEANAEEVLKAIHTSKLPDGRNFNPVRLAFVEEPLKYQGREDKKAIVKVEGYSNRRVDVFVSSRFDSFLVLSEIFYPGWNASIDGKDTRQYRTNFVLRGVEVPRGKHRIRFEYNPTSFYLGAFTSVLSLIILAGFFLRSFLQIQKEQTRKVNISEFEEAK